MSDVSCGAFGDVLHQVEEVPSCFWVGIVISSLMGMPLIAAVGSAGAVVWI